MTKTFVLALLAITAPFAARAQGFSDHPHFFGDGMMGFGVMMALGPLFFLVFAAAAVAIIVLLFRWLGDGHAHAGHANRAGRTPIDILKERFARGEIDKDEYDDRRRTLGE